MPDDSRTVAAVDPQASSTGKPPTRASSSSSDRLSLTGRIEALMDKWEKQACDHDFPAGYVVACAYRACASGLSALLASVRTPAHAPNCDTVTGKGGGLSENIIVLPTCTCDPAAPAPEIEAESVSRVHGGFPEEGQERCARAEVEALRQEIARLTEALAIEREDADQWLREESIERKAREQADADVQRLTEQQTTLQRIIDDQDRRLAALQAYVTHKAECEMALGVGGRIPGTDAAFRFLNEDGTWTVRVYGGNPGRTAWTERPAICSCGLSALHRTEG